MSNIILIGPMGAGKTTIGKQLAKSLDRPFVDSDKEIEQRTGASISLIFELEGESGFRKRETSVLEDLVSQENTIIATGGGAILSEYNRQLLSEHGYVIYLSAPLDQLLKRTAKDKNRPLLQTENPEQKIRELLEFRDPLYRETAHTQLLTGKKSIKRIIGEILDLVSSKKL